MTDTEEEVKAVALMVENFHEVRREGSPASVVLYMPESLEPFVVVRFGGLMGGSAVQHFPTAQQAARFYLGLDPNPEKERAHS